MCLRRAPEKYIAGAKAPAGAALNRAALQPCMRLVPRLFVQFLSCFDVYQLYMCSFANQMYAAW
jgi:hypothetical protein